MAAWAPGAWATGAWQGTAWANPDSLIEVPDVVGQEQAAGTSTLEGAGFVVQVATAYSDTVAAGEIISQQPAGGAQAFPGSTVTITVSLGAEPARDEVFTGGFVVAFEREMARRRKRRREQEEAEEAAQALQDQVEREIAALLHEQQAIDERKAELDRLARLVKIYQANPEPLPERVHKAMAAAIAKQTRSALLTLDRELRRAQEEEEFFMQAALMILHD